MTATKEVTFGDTSYQIGRLSARDGSWIVGQLMSRGLLNAAFNRIEEKSSEPLEKLLGLALTYAFPDMPEEVFQGVQNRCFAVCRQYRQNGDATVAEPLLRQDGSNRWNGRDEPDPLVSMALLMSALTFNLESFFAPGARKTLLQIFPDLSLMVAPAESTASSSAPSPPGSGGSAR
jgi:hypothetical protein